MSERLGGAGGRGWEEMRAAVLATGLGVEKRKRESARPTAGEPNENREMAAGPVPEQNMLKRLGWERA